MTASPGAATRRPNPWDRISVRQFAAATVSVGAARRHARALVRAWGFDDLSDAAELLVSELVTNAVRASARGGAAQRLVLRVSCSDTNLVVEVWDGGPARPTLESQDPVAEGGRGLFLVEMLSRDWGYYRPLGGGKVVWFSLPLTDAPFSTADRRAETPRPLPRRDPAVFPEPGMPVQGLADPSLLRRVVAGLRALDGWYLTAGHAP